MRQRRFASALAVIGRWRGGFYATIAPDGTLTATWGANIAWGTVTARDGQASFEMEPGPYEGGNA